VHAGRCISAVALFAWIRSCMYGEKTCVHGCSFLRKESCMGVAWLWQAENMSFAVAKIGIERVKASWK
jgi:hypothetical protein